MLLVAITGNAGSGKSALAKVFTDLKVDVINADLINSELLSCSRFMLKWLERCLSIELITESGEIDKTLLRSLLIDRKDHRKNIESHLHPIIRENIELQYSLLKDRPYCIAEIPLLFEAGMEKFADRIILMAATRKTLLSRLKYRHKMNTDQAELILDMQKTGMHVFSRSDDIILNDGKNGINKTKVSRLHDKITLLATKSE